MSAPEGCCGQYRGGYARTVISGAPVLSSSGYKLGKGIAALSGNSVSPFGGPALLVSTGVARCAFPAATCEGSKFHHVLAGTCFFPFFKIIAIAVGVKMVSF